MMRVMLALIELLLAGTEVVDSVVVVVVVTVDPLFDDCCDEMVLRVRLTDAWSRILFPLYLGVIQGDYDSDDAELRIRRSGLMSIQVE